VIACREFHERPYDWVSKPLPPRARVSASDLQELERLERLLIDAEGDLRIGLRDRAANHVILGAEGKFEDRTPSHLFTISGSGSIRYLEATIPCTHRKA
jgi:hypothetical protein